MQKRAQVQSQVFIYIMILVVIGATILFGYDALTKLQKQGSQTQSEQFKTQLARDVARIAPNYDSVHVESYNVPGASKVCFADLVTTGDAQVTGAVVCVDQLDQNQLISNSIRGGNSANVFVIGPDKFDSFSVGELSLGGCQLKCFDVQNGRLSVKITGQGDKALIESP